MIPNRTLRSILNLNLQKKMLNSDISVVLYDKRVIDAMLVEPHDRPSFKTWSDVRQLLITLIKCAHQSGHSENRRNVWLNLLGLRPNPDQRTDKRQSEEDTECNSHFLANASILP